MAATTDVPDIDPESPTQPSPAAFAKARETRPEICGSYAPERPYPIYLRGLVERGFGRGGKDLGCPTANLPSKVIQNNPSLQRTGIYYGFARVLPQDPDDPELADEQGEEQQQGQEGSAIQQGDLMEDGDEDVDVQTDEDGDDIVLSASPINEESELEFNQSNAVFKRRQMSKSSIRSARSVKTVLEHADRLSLERTRSSGSANPASDQSSPISPSSHPTGAPNALPPPPPPPPQRQSTNASASTSSTLSTVGGEKHPRHTSTTSSQASSMRRKKKQRVPITAQDARIYPMVMSVGWNPFYKNTSKTGEVHIMHNFKADFYGLEMRVVVLGYIRPEYNYVSKEALIQDIEMDKKVAINSLARFPYQDYVMDPFLMAPSL